MKTKLKIGLGITVLLSLAFLAAQINNPTSGAAPTGSAGGDLGGSFPNPTVLSVANVTTGVMSAANLPNGMPVGTDTGVVNAYVVANLSPAMTAYAVGSIGCFMPGVTSTTTTPTVNFNGLGTKTVVRQGGLALFASDMTTTEIACMVYDGTNFDLLNPQARTGTGQLVFGTSPTIGTPSFTTSITTPSTLTGNTSAVFASSLNETSAVCETAGAPTTLATGATTTDTGLNCLPANSVIDAVVARVTTTITAACTGWSLGDATTAARFASNNTTLTSGTTTDATHIGTFVTTGIASATTGIWQAAAAKVRITCAGGNAGAGAVRVIVYYHTWTAPTS